MTSLRIAITRILGSLPTSSPKVGLSFWTLLSLLSFHLKMIGDGGCVKTLLFGGEG